MTRLLRRLGVSLVAGGASLGAFGASADAAVTGAYSIWCPTAHNYLVVFAENQNTRTYTLYNYYVQPYQSGPAYQGTNYAYSYIAPRELRTADDPSGANPTTISVPYLGEGSC